LRLAVKAAGIGNGVPVRTASTKIVVRGNPLFDPKAMNNLALLLYDRGAKDEAAQLLRRASEGGNANAVTNLMLLLTGQL
jgi:hypothetical protein